MANGNFCGGNGAMDNPYLIEDGHDLSAIREDLTASYKLAKNIDLTRICSEVDGTGWVPIPAFRGSLDGNGYVVRNLFINRAAENQALFHSTRGGSILNLGVVDFNIMGGTSYAAGIVGQMTTPECLIENCYTTGTMTAVSNLGGIVGHMGGGSVMNSYSEAYINCSGSNVGGITSAIANVYAVIKNCFFGGTIVGGTGARNGIAGAVTAGTVKDSFYDSTKNLLAGGVTAKTKLEMQCPATFNNWTDQYYNFEKKTWVLRQDSYPRLFYTETTKYFVLAGGKYKTYRNQVWADVTAEFPTAEMFEQHGISDIELTAIPRFKWNDLREFGSFELVASTDKFVVERKAVRKDMVVDTQISDAVVLKTTIEFAKLGDSINKIRVLQ